MGLADRLRKAKQGLASAALNGQVARLDVATGEELWRRGVPKGPNLVVQHDGTLWVGGRGALLGFDPSTGAPTTELGLPGYPTALAAGPGGVWAVVDARRVVGIEPGSGRVLADRDAGALSRIAVGGDAVWVSYRSRHVTAGAIAALDPADGAERLRVDVAGQPGGIALGDDTVWVARGASANGRVPGAVLALDAVTGEIVAELPAAAGVSDVAVADRAVFAAGRGGEDATVTKLDPRSGRTLTHAQTPDRPAVLVACHGTVWVASWRPNLRLRKGTAAIYRLDARSGRAVDSWKIKHTPIDLAAAPDAVWITTFDTIDYADASTLTALTS